MATATKKRTKQSQPALPRTLDDIPERIEACNRLTELQAELTENRKRQAELQKMLNHEGLVDDGLSSDLRERVAAKLVGRDAVDIGSTLADRREELGTLFDDVLVLQLAIDEQRKIVHRIEREAAVKIGEAHRPDWEHAMTAIGDAIVPLLEAFKVEQDIRDNIERVGLGLSGPLDFGGLTGSGWHHLLYWLKENERFCGGLPQWVVDRIDAI